MMISQDHVIILNFLGSTNACDIAYFTIIKAFLHQNC